MVCYQGMKRGPNPTEQRERRKILFVYEYPPDSQAEGMARMGEAPTEPEGLGDSSSLWCSAEVQLCTLLSAALPVVPSCVRICQNTH